MSLFVRVSGDYSCSAGLHLEIQIENEGEECVRGVRRLTINERSECLDYSNSRKQSSKVGYKYDTF